jgi:hypothetical protein
VPPRAQRLRDHEFRALGALPPERLQHHESLRAPNPGTCRACPGERHHPHGPQVPSPRNPAPWPEPPYGAPRATWTLSTLSTLSTPRATRTLSTLSTPSTPRTLRPQGYNWPSQQCFQQCPSSTPGFSLPSASSPPSEPCPLPPMSRQCHRCHRCHRCHQGHQGHQRHQRHQRHQPGREPECRHWAPAGHRPISRSRYRTPSTMPPMSNPALSPPRLSGLLSTDPAIPMLWRFPSASVES